eukprot:403346717
MSSINSTPQQPITNQTAPPSDSPYLLNMPSTGQYGSSGSQTGAQSSLDVAFQNLPQQIQSGIPMQQQPMMNNPYPSYTQPQMYQSQAPGMMPLQSQFQQQMPIMQPPQQLPIQPISEQKLDSATARRVHSYRVHLVRTQLDKNPEFFTPDEIEEYQRYYRIWKSSFLDLAFYVIISITGRPAAAVPGQRLIFPAARIKNNFWRILFLNMFFAENLISSYRDAHLKERLAKKYFGHIQSPAQIPPTYMINAADKQSQNLQGQNQPFAFNPQQIPGQQQQFQQPQFVMGLLQPNLMGTANNQQSNQIQTQTDQQKLAASSPYI